MSTLVRRFRGLTMDDLPEVGGKNASLGEMLGALSEAGVRVPDGFATTADAYRGFLAASGADQDLVRILEGLDVSDVAELARRGRSARERILAAPFPAELEDAIRAAYGRLSAEHGEAATDVAVRSSATAEDLPDASFAGQQETFLNVRGERALLEAVRRCFASLYTDRAIAYRVSRGFAHEQVALSAGVQKMVRADLGAAGVIFTLDTETGFPDVVMINAAYGLGENVVRGTVTPDEYTVFKPTLADGHRPILRRRLGEKALKMVYDRRGGTRTTRNLPVPEGERQRFALSDDEVLQLARWAMLIEQHYGARAGEPRPMDIEWARDGRSGELFVLQARPETVQSRRDRSLLEAFRLDERGEELVTGRAVGARIGAGAVRLVRGPEEMAAFQEGEVLVAEMTDPDWVPVMRKAAAIVTERGGRTCHAAIVSRELGVPAVVGAVGALDALSEGDEVTVCCAEGEVGRVFRGRLPFHVERTRLDELPPRRTGVMLNAADPDRAFELAALPVDGVGLARMEFIITHAIRAHPLALLRWPELADPDAVEEIAALARSYASPSELFVTRLAEGVGCLAAAFWPRPVILRLSDFKTNEYAGLGGRRRVRAPRREPDARLPRGQPLRPSPLPRGLRPGVRGDPPRASGHGPAQPQAHAALLPDRRRGPRRPGRSRRGRPGSAVATGWRST